MKTIDANELLKRLESLRQKKQYSSDPADYIVRLCEAEVSELAGYKDRVEMEQAICSHDFYLQQGNVDQWCQKCGLIK